MLYNPVSIKILNPDEFEDFQYKDEDWKGKLIIEIKYGNKTVNNNLPVTFAFRYRIYVNDKHVSTFLADYTYHLIFLFDEDPYNELVLFLGQLILFFIEEFYRVAKIGTIPNPKAVMSNFKNDFIINFANDIIREAQSQLLIQQQS